MTWGDLRNLKEIRRMANFENSNFDGIAENWRMEKQGNKITLVRTSHEYDEVKKAWSEAECEYTFTEFIKERTRLYRDSWVNPLLDELIAKAEKQLKVKP